MNVDDRLSPRAARRVEEEALQDQIHELNFMAAMRYRPRPYPGVVTNFKPRRNYSAFPDPDMGWNGLALEGVKTIELDLFPHAMMTEPFLELLADDLSHELSVASCGARPVDTAGSRREG